MSVLVPLENLRERRSIKWSLYPADVLPAWVAEMDFSIAPPIAEALHAAIDRSDIGYRNASGLGEAFADYSSRTWGWQFDPKSVTAVGDVVTGVAETIRHLTEPGSSVVINTPVYPPFFSSVRDVAKRGIVEAPLRRQDDGCYAWDLEAMEQAFARPEVTAYLMCHPHNPTGTVATRADLEAIAEMAQRHGVAVVSDEIHGPLAYPGTEHLPYLAIAGDDANAVCVTSASKSWNIPGLKCAQVVTTSRSAPAIAGMPMEITFGSGHLGVLAGIAAYEQGQPWLDEVVAILDSNRTALADLVATRLPGVGYHVPDATYLAWLDFRGVGGGDNPYDTLLEAGRVALSPGPNYGSNGKGFARLNFATSPEILEQVVDRVAVGVAAMHP